VAVVSREGGHRVALMNMGNRPLRAEAVEAELQAGTPWNEAAALAAEGTEPPSDVLANAGYRRALAAVLVRRALAGAQKARC